MQTTSKKPSFIMTMMVAVSLVVTSLFATAQSSPEQPGYYRTQIGKAEVFTLLDGTYDLNVKEHLHGISKRDITSVMRGNFLDTTVALTFSAFLVRTEGQLILIDAGSGAFMGPGLGKVVKNLQAAGIQPEDINAVLITHGHADHLGGLVNNKERVFANATVYISKMETGYWLGPANKEKASKENAPFFEIAQSALIPYQKVGKLRTFEAGAHLFAGITAMDLHGHTPGLSGYLLESDGQHIAFIGDMVHIAAVQFPNPTVTIDYDVDQQTAAATRLKAFQELAKEGYWIAAPHMSFPGVGHIRSAGNGYQWVPANFNDRFTRQ